MIRPFLTQLRPTLTIALAAALAVPVLALVTHAARQSVAAPADNPAAHDASSSHGPWGRVRHRRITLAPPASALRSLDAPAAPVRWRFPDTDRHRLADFLAQLPISESAFASLLDVAEADPGIGGFVIEPGPELVEGLTAPARAALYRELGHSPLNLAQVNAFRFWGESADDWLEAVRLPADLHARLRPYIYRHGEFLFLADAATVLESVQSAEDRLQLLQALGAERTLVTTLEVAEGQNVEPLVEYWGTGGRDKAVRPLLQSLADTPGGGSIDVTHLLPPFARQRLYTYPRDPGTTTADVSRDCHWTALNFFNRTPDPRYATASQVEDVLANRCRPVDEPRFGDLVVLVSEGEIFHSAVYVADNVVFTRNGTRRVRPWMLLPLNAMTDFYPKREAVEVVYLRRDGPPTAGASPPTRLTRGDP